MDWIARDASSRSATARVVFLGSIVGGEKTEAVVREVLQTMDAFPGSTLISGRNERKLLEFLEDTASRREVQDWMDDLGGWDVLKSFGIPPETRRYSESRFAILSRAPRVLDLLQSAKEYEVEDGFCFVEGYDIPDDPLFRSEPKDFTDEALSVWHRATGKTIVHVNGGATTHYTECQDHIGFGISPKATGWLSALTIDDGEAARYLLAHRQERAEPVRVEALPLDRTLGKDPELCVAIGSSTREGLYNGSAASVASEQLS